ncbi:hypothetical protein AMAG_08275 [Allomyces macrogynus ATCC 38327]|uniref:Uncharacterized protein n=1 Tax=Allomyces macrogynus (strain ATCC 38327) TaxID=578462 RepID=A0A0L0SL48_ALLM3|nr:hypothetical protein AMAG_08275 [Allomyces macrogynus ATCC 38327]|eukprot:KNE63109.1 hypothetical protein AMAG_08275 [Allomyces macrogynus ATCC 38327]
MLGSSPAGVPASSIKGLINNDATSSSSSSPSTTTVSSSPTPTGGRALNRNGSAVQRITNFISSRKASPSPARTPVVDYDSAAESGPEPDMTMSVLSAADARSDVEKKCRAVFKQLQEAKDVLCGKADAVGAVAAGAAAIKQLVDVMNENGSKTKKRADLYFRLGTSLAPLLSVENYDDVVKGALLIMHEFEQVTDQREAAPKRMTKVLRQRITSVVSSSSAGSDVDPYRVSIPLTATGAPALEHFQDVHIPCELSAFHVTLTFLDVLIHVYDRIYKVPIRLDDPTAPYLRDAVYRLDHKLHKAYAPLVRDVNLAAKRVVAHLPAAPGSPAGAASPGRTPLPLDMIHAA